jgi:hypothetical protein
MIKELSSPSAETNPTNGPPSSKASGIIVEDTIATIPPAAKAPIEVIYERTHRLGHILIKH